MLQGCLYLLIGSLFLLMPSIASMLMLMFVDENEAGALRMFGLAVNVVGYFYIQGARSAGDIETLVAETTFDRLTFVPVCCLLLMFFGYSRAMLCIAFILLDPALAMLTALRWEQEKASSDKDGSGNAGKSD